MILRSCNCALKIAPLIYAGQTADFRAAQLEDLEAFNYLCFATEWKVRSKESAVLEFK